MSIKSIPLREVIEIQKGKKPKHLSSSISKKTPESYVTIEAFEHQKSFQYASDDKNMTFSDNGDLLIVWDGSRFGLVGKSIGGVVGSTLAKIIPKRYFERDFLFYFLHKSYEILRSRKRGMGIPHLDSSIFDSVRIPLFAQSEQKRIVEILDQVDVLQKKRKEADKIAERIIPALFYKMFEDPISNPHSSRKNTFNELLKKSKNALQSGPFGSHLHNSDFVDNGEILAVGIDNVFNDGFKIGRNRRITKEKYKELKKFALFPNDVLITIMGTIGRTCVFPEWVGKAICTKHVYRIQLNDDELNPVYLSSAIKFSQSVRSQLGMMATGQIVKGLNSKDLKTLKIEVPPIKLQKKFAEIVMSHDNERTKRNSSEMKLHQLYKTLLNSAFSGNLTAKWRESHITELFKEMEIQTQYLNEAKI